MHYVTVLHDIFFAFYPHFAGFANCGLAPQLYVIAVFDYFGAYESFFKIGVDDAGALRCFRAAHESPGSHFVRSGCEISL